MGQEEAFSRNPEGREAELETFRLWGLMDPAAHAYSDGNSHSCDPIPPSSHAGVRWDFIQISLMQSICVIEKKHLETAV